MHINVVKSPEGTNVLLILIIAAPLLRLNLS